MLPTLPPSLFFFLFFLFTPCLSQDNEIYASCAARSCGNIPAGNISYPFWFEDQPEHCGRPTFKLYCRDDQYTEIEMLGETFGVGSIDPGRHALTLVDKDLAGATCTTPSASTTVDTAAFHFSDQDLNLSLYYECPVDVPVDYLYFFPFPCSPNADDTNAVFTLLPPHHPSYSSCKFANITLSNTVRSILQTNTSFSEEEVQRRFGDAVRMGFEVIWRATDFGWCQGCMDSGGRCGYNPDVPEQRVCLCKVEPHEANCQGDRIKLGMSFCPFYLHRWCGLFDGEIRTAHTHTSSLPEASRSLVAKSNVSSSVRR